MIISVARHLEAHGDTAEIWCPNGGGVPGAPLSIVSIPVRTTVARNCVLAARTFLRLALRGRGVDVVHVHQPHIQSLAAIVAAKVLGTAAVVTYHVLVPEKRPIRRAQVRILTALQNRLVDSIVVVSSKVAETYRLREFRVISNGVDPTRPPLSQSETVNAPEARPLEVVFAGRVTQTKGIFVLLRALAQAKEVIGDVQLTTFGPIDDPVEYEHEKQSLGVAGRVRDMGFVLNWHSYLRPGQVFASPSFYEGMPLALLEAMAFGLAVVATPVGSVGEVVRDGQTGLLVPVNDSQALASALVWFARNPERVRQLGEQARKVVAANYTTQQMGANYSALYRELGDG